MKRTRVNAGWLVLAGAVAFVCMAADGGAATRVTHLTLHSALPGDRPMEVHMVLAGGKVSAAFAEARTFNTMSYPVDASKLKATSKGVTGEIVVTVPSDGWVPKGGRSLKCVFEISVIWRNDQAHGTYKGTRDKQAVRGKITGGLVDQAARPERCRFELTARAPKGKKGLRRVGVEMGWRDGKAIGVKLIPHGSITDIGPDTIATKASVRFRRSQLTGRIEGVVQGGGDEKGKPLVIEFDALVIGDVVGGTVRTKLDDGPWVTGSIRGRMNTSDAPEPGEAIWKLTMTHGVSPGRPMNVFVSTGGGKVTNAFAVTPNYNNATHEVDTSKLTLKDGRLTGEIDVTIFPDAWIPKNHKKQAASYRISAELTDAEVSGTFLGRFAGRDVKGQIIGVARSKPEVGEITRATIKPEGGLWNGSWSGYRAFFTFDVEDGKITGGRVWNNHDKALKGTVESGTFNVKDETLTATMVAEIKPGTSAKPGRYTITVTGPVMGTVSCGNSVSKLGEKTWTSRYWASWKYHEKQ
ncbi:MAG: hypothetical protein ACOCWV_02785 [Planctomycetota bacterium]